MEELQVIFGGKTSTTRLCRFVGVENLFSRTLRFFRSVFYEPIAGKEILNRVVIVGSPAETSISVA